MLTDSFSYVVIDSEVDVSVVTRAARRHNLVSYSFGTPFAAQVSAATRRGSTIL
jgi:hypothetical protein